LPLSLIHIYVYKRQQLIDPFGKTFGLDGL